MIVVECFLDTYVVHSLGVSRKSIKHTRGKGKVLKKVREQARDRVIGIVDEDPGNARSADMGNYIESETLQSVKLLTRRDDDNKRLIEISPRLEEWILHRAKQNKISPKEYNLPEDGEELHKILHVEKKKDFQQFFQQLLDSNDDELNKMREWLTETVGSN
jgi:hypothetical protein